MRHTFMEGIARRLADEGVATLRWEMPYMAEGKRRPDPPAVAVAAVRRAVDAARGIAPGLALFAGGKSFGGRMTSTAASQDELAAVRGLVFLGFPLHAAGRPGTARADHLAEVSVPMLFLQGTRDALADLALLEPVLAGLGGRAALHREEDADHGFHVPKRSGRTDADVLASLAHVTARWIDGRTF
jgi:hypothetical protein